MDGIFNIYWNTPFQIRTFKIIEVSPELVNKCVGVYTIPGAPLKFTAATDSVRF
ncbi:MAG: hypothetical protein OEM82_03610 [Acidobacteriota bacterium]|nr:hypothetical protein [Acidobacteriota bacterium]MDH3529656.1 hypothetical protein [Acidobacteriota bacterium]